MDLYDYEISIDEMFSDIWFAHLLQKIKERKVLDHKIYMQNSWRKILCKIKSKFKIIQTHQSLWLNSFLEKYRPDMKIDRAVITNPQNAEEKILILELKEVKRVAANTFAQQFRKRRTKLDSLS